MATKRGQRLFFYIIYIRQSDLKSKTVIRDKGYYTIKKGSTLQRENSNCIAIVYVCVCVCVCIHVCVCVCVYVCIHAPNTTVIL